MRHRACRFTITATVSISLSPSEEDDEHISPYRQPCLTERPATSSPGKSRPGNASEPSNTSVFDGQPPRAPAPESRPVNRTRGMDGHRREIGCVGSTGCRRAAPRCQSLSSYFGRSDPPRVDEAERWAKAAAALLMTSAWASETWRAKTCWARLRKAHGVPDAAGRARRGADADPPPGPPLFLVRRPDHHDSVWCPL